MCDAVYAIIIERLERQVLAIMATGAKLNLDAVVAHFDAALISEPEADRLDPEQRALRRALGVA